MQNCFPATAQTDPPLTSYGSNALSPETSEYNRNNNNISGHHEERRGDHNFIVWVECASYHVLPCRLGTVIISSYFSWPTGRNGTSRLARQPVFGSYWSCFMDSSSSGNFFYSQDRYSLATLTWRRPFLGSYFISGISVSLECKLAG